MRHIILLLLFTIIITSCQTEKAEYICLPCNLACDSLTFEKAGLCPHCKMDLMLASEVEAELKLKVNEISITNGSGKFLIEGGYDKSKTIPVHYYKPKKFTPNSEVILVIPGAGRNGRSYRDAWKEASEKYGLLVISPEYSEKHYPGFWNYNLAGMYKDVKLNDERTAIEHYQISDNSKEWIFNDFDRIFDLVKDELHLKTETYDIFGHSAGGQILHRYGIFKSDNKANRILASNSGWYTLPKLSVEFPYGLKNIKAQAEELDFSKNLVLFLGEQDNASETRGSLRRSPEADTQGLHRLERGKYFYNESKKIASELNSEFNWKLEIIPDVRHDFREMSKAAADYLYKRDK